MLKKKLLAIIACLFVATISLIGCESTNDACAHKWGEWETITDSTCQL